MGEAAMKMSGMLDWYEADDWDRFFDFVIQPVEQMTWKEVQQELKDRGIDVTKAVSNQAVTAAKGNK